MADSHMQRTPSTGQNYYVGYAPPPQLTAAQSKVYAKNISQWTATPPPKTPTPASSSRPSRSSRATKATQQTQQTPVQTWRPPVTGVAPPAPVPAVQHSPLPTKPQATYSTYGSRLRTGSTLLMQPIFASTSAANNARQSSRRGTAVNYADPGSADELPDAGALDSDDSDFVASGGLRTSIRTSRRAVGSSSIILGGSGSGASTPLATLSLAGNQLKSADVDKSYLGLVPPPRLIKQKPFAQTSHLYPSQEELEVQAEKSSSLIPIRVEFETDTHRIRDCFVWNLHETLIKPDTFARIFCTDLELPLDPWAETVANQIRAQIEDHENVAGVDLSTGVNDSFPPGMDENGVAPEDTAVAVEMNPECRVLLSIDVQIGTYHLVDHIEWDLLSPLTPELFAGRLCDELGLSGEALPLIAHAIHEELIKHKKDALEWGVIGGERDKNDDRSGGQGVTKDKTGLGPGWGRSHKDGRVPRTLKSAWRDWQDAEEFGTTFEVLSQEEVERREIERERASRRLRRETSKFQSTRTTRRR